MNFKNPLVPVGQKCMIDGCRKDAETMVMLLGGVDIGGKQNATALVCLSHGLLTATRKLMIRMYDDAKEERKTEAALRRRGVTELAGGERRESL